jgi:hypothetical protein
MPTYFDDLPNAGGDREKPKDGKQPGVIAQFLYMGTVTDEYQGKVRTFEEGLVIAEVKEESKQYPGQRLTVWYRFPLKKHPKSKMSALLRELYGAAADASDFGTGKSLEELLEGQPVIADVVNKPTNKWPTVKLLGWFGDNPLTVSENYRPYEPRQEAGEDQREPGSDDYNGL